jgi:uncharacterized protein YciW
MNQDADQLRETFVAHEYLAPDAADVLAVVHDKARRYRRRRRAAQSAGGAVLGAGLVAGTVAAPGWLNATSNRHSGSSLSLAAPAPQPTPTPLTTPSVLASPSAVTSPAAVTSPSPLTSAQQDAAINAYFAAGYDYNDALALAQLWHMSADPSTIKAEAGRRLLAGQTLPFKPSAAGVATAAEDADLNAFFGAGYTYQDAVTLAQLWNGSDPYQAKIDAGKKLIAGETLPIAPGSQPTAPTVATSSSDAATTADLNAYFAAGYTYEDALGLAGLWKIADAYQVKVDAGAKLLAGETLPIAPGSQPTSAADTSANAAASADDAAVGAFFKSGYTYDDAVTLGKLWKDSDTYQVKIDAGKKLIAGQALPFKPKP